MNTSTQQLIQQLNCWEIHSLPDLFRKSHTWNSLGWVRAFGCLRIGELVSDEAEFLETSHYWRQWGGRLAINYLYLKSQSSLLLTPAAKQSVWFVHYKWLVGGHLHDAITKQILSYQIQQSEANLFNHSLFIIGFRYSSGNDDSCGNQWGY